jgi:hypothetical protein
MSHLPYPEDEHEARVICGDPQALAYEWIKAYAKNLSDQCADEEYSSSEVTVDELLDTADSHQPESNSRWGGDYITRGGAFEGQGVEPMFWEKYAVLKGKSLDEVEESHFFSCSC